ncbi:hypothetical protein QBC47DRAFT_431649 [Echria macrotheca]|uniref:Uncharacterized protein n=1 Tax=Echria macrotheca TaxID=438768 RepID=A0AAJ0B7Q6_9PEZI|nr:hypothetical protein QBC47DRAFT_431649 [Echria macrotheca]
MRLQLAATTLLGGFVAFVAAKPRTPLPEPAREHSHCGYAIVDHYKSYSEFELFKLIPRSEKWTVRNTLYWIDANGYAVEALGFCDYVCLEFGDGGAACLTDKSKVGEDGEDSDGSSSVAE